MVMAVRRSFGTDATTSANMALGPNHTFCLRAEETAELCRAYPRRYRPSCSRAGWGVWRIPPQPGTRTSACTAARAPFALSIFFFAALRNREFVETRNPGCRMLNRSEKIFVAGQRGLVGRALVRKLEADGFANLVKRDRAQLDLTKEA